MGQLFKVLGRGLGRGLIVVSITIFLLALAVYFMPTADRLRPIFSNTAPPASTYLIARQAEKSNDIKAAASHYQQLVQSAGEPSLRLLEDSIRSNLLTGDVAGALRPASLLLERNPHHQRANLLAVLSHIKAGRWQAAQTHLSQLPRSPMQKFLSPHINLWLSFALDDTSGRAAALRALQNNSTFVPINFAQAALAAEYDGDIEAATKFYNAGVHAKGMQHLFFAISYAAFLERQGNVLKAANTYRQFENTRFAHPIIAAGLVRLENGAPPPILPQSVPYHLAHALGALAELLQAQRQDSLALIYGTLAHYLVEDDAEAADFAPLLLFQNASRASALEFYSMAQEYFSRVQSGAMAVRAKIRSTELWDALDKTETAIADLSNIADTNLEEQNNLTLRHEALIALGDLYRRHDRFAEAERAYSRAINFSDNKLIRWNLYFARGIARERMGVWELAELDLQKARRLSRNDPHVLNYLGYSWADKGVYLHEALQIIKQAVLAMPHNGAFVDSLGWANYKLGNYGAALAFLERASELEPTDATITDHLGDVLWQLGRKTEARYQWRKALAFDPEPALRKQIEIKQKLGATPPPKYKAQPRRQTPQQRNDPSFDGIEI